MSLYLILGICAAILMMGYTLRRWQLKRTFQKFASMQSSILIDNQAHGKNRVLGSFVFNLEITDSDIKEVVFTHVGSSDPNLLLKEFEQIKFYRTDDHQHIPMRSIGFKTSRKTAKEMTTKDLYVHVDGYIMTYERQKIRFSLTNRVEKQEEFAFPKATLFNNPPLAY